MIEGVEPLLVDVDYEVTPEDAERIEAAARSIHGAERGGGRTLDQVRMSCLSIVMELALVRLVPGAELLDYRRHAGDVRLPDGRTVDVKRQRLGWWEFEPRHVSNVYDNLGAIDLVLTGDYDRIEGSSFRVTFRQVLEASSMFRGRTRGLMGFSNLVSLSHYSGKRERGVHVYNHRMAEAVGVGSFRKGTCA